MATRLNNTQGQKNREMKETVTEQKPRSGKVILAIMAGLVLLGAGAGGAAWYFSHIQDGAATAKPPVFSNLDTFTVNLQSEYNDQHLQTNLTLKVASGLITWDRKMPFTGSMKVVSLFLCLLVCY